MQQLCGYHDSRVIKIKFYTEAAMTYNRTKKRTQNISTARRSVNDRKKVFASKDWINLTIGYSKISGYSGFADLSICV